MTLKETAQYLFKGISGKVATENDLPWIEQELQNLIEKEREECAKIADGHEKDHRSAPEDSPVQYAASEAATLASAIRARNRKGIDR